MEAKTVIIVGVVNGAVTATGHGVQMFDSFAHARATFADLDPKRATKRFAKPVYQHDGLLLRIETKAARRLRTIASRQA
ncbi:hypothetical protein [Schauerella aestuarii]|uniref:hypothetical protein n=1 Tax=Schauerella aestuarii TaxID=2511204 RepID=UPI001368B0F5|nr:hypothetical protein [Achromobacter aestuarii]MYZ44199.1 hypothetical protein [Achromobacter aestuarii]